MNGLKINKEVLTIVWALANRVDKYEMNSRQLAALDVVYHLIHPTYPESAILDRVDPERMA